MSERGQRTPISELGKYGLIDRLTGEIRVRNRSTILTSGDDAAAIDNGGELTLVSADLMLEGIHFNLVYTPLRHLGYKSVIRAISDIYAMNGTPGQLLVSIGISSRFSVEEIEEIYEGIKIACEKYDVDLAGGDTSSSLTGLTIGVTAIGKVRADRMVRRSGASPNDLICVTGDLGAAYMGLQLLERERKIFESGQGVRPVLTGREYIVGRQLKPEFPCKVIEQLADNGIIPTSMIDISEGLASDLLQICKSSGKGCRIFCHKIPVSEETAAMADEFGIDPLIPALNGGEDYELLFTVPPELYDKIMRTGSVKAIGHITQDDYGRFLVSEDGEEIELQAQGWKR